MDHRGRARAPGGTTGGEQAARAGREQARDWRKETMRGEEGFRVGNRVGVRIDGGATVRECVESADIQKGWHWGMIRADWNGATRARGHNSQDTGSRCVRTTSGRVQKGTGT